MLQSRIGNGVARRLFVVAFQSYLFNELLAARLDRMGALEQGDLATKHVSGTCWPHTACHLKTGVWVED